VSADATDVRDETPERKDVSRAHGAARKDVARRDRSEDKTIPHGTAGGYVNHKCSCTPCSRAWAETCFTAKERRLAKGLPPGDPRHGTDNGYSNWGCPCDLCREAHNEAKRRYTQKRQLRKT
jgi:hypothetical protein